MNIVVIPIIPVILLILSILVLSSVDLSAEAPAPAKALGYETDIKPIFLAECAQCHNEAKAKGGLSLESFEAMMRGGGSGAVIVPGKSTDSRLFRLITRQEEPYMPLQSDKLEDDVIARIQKWIDAGAPKDAATTVAAAPTSGTAQAVATPPANGTPTSGTLAASGPMPVGLPPAQLTKLAGPLAIRTAATSSVAPLLAVAGQKQILLYNTDTTQSLGALDFPEGTPRSLVFSPNGAMLVAAGGEPGRLGVAALYDVASGRRVEELGMTFDTLLAADISLDHRQVALGGTSNTVKVYATATKQVDYQLTGNSDWVTAVAFSPDGWYLATADRSGVICTWLAESGRDVTALRGHEGGVEALAFRPDSHVLASAGDDGTIRLWDMEESKQIRSWTAHPGGALSITWAADGRLLSAGADGLTKIWKEDGGELAAFPKLSDWAFCARFSNNFKRVIAGSYLGEIKVWDVASKTEVSGLHLQ